MSKDALKTNLRTLASLFLTARTPKEMEELLEDFLTPAEAQDLVERWKIVSELLAEKTQREIRDQLGVSIAKVSRGSRIVQYGSGAFRRSKNRI